ncbi:MAG: P-II family nitrogen regulator [Gemmatimonadales bacterium]
MLRLIKAVVRHELLEELVQALNKAGVPRLSVSNVQTTGSGVDPKQAKLSQELGTGYTEKVLMQFVCAAEQVDDIVNIVVEHAHTGCRGDGIVFVLPVERVVKIRTGVEGVAALM